MADRLHSWVLTHGDYDDTEIVAVFDDQADAYAVRNRLGRGYDVKCRPRYPTGNHSYRGERFWTARAWVNPDGVVTPSDASPRHGYADDHGPLIGDIWPDVQRASFRRGYIATGAGTTQEGAAAAARRLADRVAAQVRAGADPRDIVNGPTTPAQLALAWAEAIGEWDEVRERREAEEAAKARAAEEARWWRETRVALHVDDKRVGNWHPVADGYIQIPTDFRGAPQELALRTPDGSFVDLHTHVAGVLNTPLQAVVWETSRSLRH